jgi:uncharacterized protein (TIGR00299 family) protein
MNIAYLDCASGISGDMMLGTLVDVGVPVEQLNEAIGSLGLPGCRLVAEEVRKTGFRATQVRVEYAHEHAHRHLHHILTMIDGSRLSPRQKELAARIFRRLAAAEAKVHGTTIDKVHFHEVGAADSIADIVGTAVGWELLGIEQVVASAIPVGGGKIRIAHGEVSVPAPATAELLRGVPLAPSAVEKELTTPTGAAIVTTLAQRFGALPPMRLERIGCGAGQRDLEEQPNLLRLLLGQSDADGQTEQIWVAETNLDDTTGEMIGYCTARLWEAGVLDVYTTPIQMKKNRPAVMLSVLCREEQLARVSAILFAETTTLGVRQWPVRRQVLRRQAHSVQTSWGPVEGKVAWLADQPRFAPEYEACRAMAEQHKLPLRAVYEAAHQAFDPHQLRSE